MKLRINYLRVRLIDENKMTDAEKAGILEYFSVLRYKDFTLVTVCYDYIYYYKTSDKGLKD
jgi:hypothetical protein